METKFNFKSQICTSKSQSETLLKLGLKKETADMALVPLMEWDDCTAREYFTGIYVARTKEDVERYNLDYIPAWSLGRLIKDLKPQSIGHLELAVGSDYAGYYEDRCNSESGMHWEYVEETSDMFDNIISTIEWLIKEGYFNKEYLV